MRASDLDLILIPDAWPAPPDHWLTRWGAKLSTARLLEEGEALVAAVAAARRPVFLIGHSLGAVTAAEAAPALVGHDIRGAFLVAPPTEGALMSLQPGRTLLRERLPFPSLLVASRTDPWAPFSESEALASAWGAALVDAGESGRIDHESGHGPWPDGLLRLAGVLKGL